MLTFKQTFLHERWLAVTKNTSRAAAIAGCGNGQQWDAKTHSHVLRVKSAERSEAGSALSLLNGPQGEKPLTNKRKTSANICDSHFAHSFHSSARLSLPPSVAPWTRLPSLSLASVSPRGWTVDKCAAITSVCTRALNTHACKPTMCEVHVQGRTSTRTHNTHTHTNDWQAWHKFVTPQWLPAIMFDWQLMGPSSLSCMHCLIMTQWQPTAGQKICMQN